MRWLTVCVLILPAISPAWSSEPGQPLDCDDWVFLVPGLSCIEVVPYPCPNLPGYPPQTLCTVSDDNRALDNRGDRLWVRRVQLPSCDGNQRNRIEVVRLRGSQEQVLAYVDGRCNGPLVDDIEIFASTIPGANFSEPSSVVKFDATNGRLLTTLTVYCSGQGCGYSGDDVLWAIAGFASLLETFQSYEPTANTFGFTVPLMPEGLAGVDWFDTYYGSLDTVGDWTQAQPLQCGYPSVAPSVGDFLTVANPLPAPAVGAGYYFVTAATFNGETRYGRRNLGGRLTGRDPSVLPPCK